MCVRRDRAAGSSDAENTLAVGVGGSEGRVNFIRSGLLEGWDGRREVDRKVGLYSRPKCLASSGKVRAMKHVVR